MNRRVSPLLAAACVLAWATLAISAQGNPEEEGESINN